MSYFLKEFNRLSTNKTNNKVATNSLVNQFGTACYPQSFRLALKVIKQQGNWLYCQALSSLDRYKVAKDHFYPLGHPYNLLLIDQQIAEYNEIPSCDREAAYNSSDIEVLKP